MDSNYYNILGVSENANLEEIKNAYRQKAKELHPDKNKRLGAHEEFIILVEAYDYLVNLKSNKVRLKQTFTHEDWVRTNQEETRQRARKYAQMRYEEFLKSDYYKTSTYTKSVFTLISFLIALSIFTIIPIILIAIYGISGILISILVIIITLPMSVNAIRNRPKFDIETLIISFKYLIKTKAFQVILISLLNIFLFFKIGLQTLIPFYVLIGIFFISIFIVLTITMRFISLVKKMKPSFIAFCLTPLFINLVLSINFFVSFNPTIETYHFMKVKQEVYSEYSRRLYKQESTFIILEGRKYSQFLGIRFFIDYEKMVNRKSITYTFKEGIFGIRVMKDYKFE